MEEDNLHCYEDIDLKPIYSADRDKVDPSPVTK